MELETIPMYDKTTTRFQRAEQAGHHLVAISGVPDVFTLLNSTANEILDLCDGQKNIQTIVDEMLRRYPSANLDLITKDVLNSLFVFDRMGVLNWKGKRPPALLFTAPTVRLDEAVEVGRFSEDDFGDLSNFVKRFSLESKRPDTIEPLYIWPMTQSFFYSPMLLRKRLFFFAEDFYFFKRAGEIKGIISFLTNKPILKSQILSTILLLPGEEKNRMLNNLLNVAKLDLIKRSSKLSVHIKSNDPGKDTLIGYLEEANFKKEAELIDEFDFGIDDLIYSYKFEATHFDVV